MVHSTSPADFLPFSSDVAGLVHGLPGAAQAWAGLFVVLDALTVAKALDDERWMMEARIESGLTTLGLHTSGFDDIQRAFVQEFRQYEGLMPYQALERCFGVDRDQAERERITVLRAMPYQEYLQTAEWARTRTDALVRADHRCQVCNARALTVQLDVHHRTYDGLGAEIPADLIVLCRECHGLYHSRMRRP